MVIGCGNYLRMDDGVGLWIGARIRAKFRGEKGIKVLLLHQLVPELLEELKDAKCVIFIDASLEGEDWSLRRINLGGHIAPLNYVSHISYPEEILSLLVRLYRRKPEAWILSVRGEDFSFGAGLSVKTRKLAEEAEKLLYSLINSKLERCMSFH